LRRDEWVTLKELAVKIQARGYDGEFVNSDLREALMNVAPRRTARSTLTNSATG
jgi:hypothetical protein